MEASLLGGKKIITLTKAQYDALSSEAKVADVIYYITDDTTSAGDGTYYTKTEIDNLLANYPNDVYRVELYGDYGDTVADVLNNYSGDWIEDKLFIGTIQIPIENHDNGWVGNIIGSVYKPLEQWTGYANITGGIYDEIDMDDEFHFSGTYGCLEGSWQQDTIKQDIITANGVLQGDGQGNITAKAVDSTPTASSTNLVTSGGVATAIANPTAKTLGTFSTLAELGTLLDTELSNMANSSVELIRATAGATIYPFYDTYVYTGHLYKSGASTTYSSAILSPTGPGARPVWCKRSPAYSWEFEPITTDADICNPNLLDNWYFVGGGSQLGRGTFPINSRGLTSYSGALYGLDRWISTNSNGTVAIFDDYITMTAEASGNAFLRQWLKPIVGTFTISYLLRGSGTGYIGVNTDDAGWTLLLSRIFANPGSEWTLVTVTGIATESSPARLATLRVNAGTSIDVMAAKLELGDMQTLAHQENGVWVLNEIPNYAEQLIRCKSSAENSADTYANNSIAFVSNNASSSHNSIYRGNDITSYLTNGTLWDRINGTNGFSLFEDLYIGDYIQVTKHDVTTNYVIVHFDYYYNTGPSSSSLFTQHHLVMMPRASLNLKGYNDSSQLITTANAGQTVTVQESNYVYKWNATMSAPNTATTAGGYIASRMRTVVMPWCNAMVEDAFGAAHIAEINVRYPITFASATSGVAATSGWASEQNYDLSKCDLPNEVQIFGSQICGLDVNGTAQHEVGIDCIQFAYFQALSHPMRNAAGSIWWRSVCSETQATRLAYGGYPHAFTASAAQNIMPRFVLVG